MKARSIVFGNERMTAQRLPHLDCWALLFVVLLMLSTEPVEGALQTHSHHSTWKVAGRQNTVAHDMSFVPTSPGAWSQLSMMTSQRNINRKVGFTKTAKESQPFHARVRGTTTLLRASSNNGDSTKTRSASSRATAVYVLMLINFVVYVADKVLQKPFVPQQLYLYHRRWRWWQPLTSSFCHMNRGHLINNSFMLLLFGRSIEDDWGWGGLILSFVFCGVVSSLVSILLLPANTVSLGASGSVFGLFTVSVLAKLEWKDGLDWRKWVELVVLGEFVFGQLASEVSTVARGGHAGVNHVAHLSGAAAGAVMVKGMQAVVASFDRKKIQKAEREQKAERNQKSSSAETT